MARRHLDYFKGAIVGLTAMAVALPVLAQTQLEMSGQAARDFQAADRRLSATYDALLAKIEPDAAAELRTVQQTWRRFREENCAFESRTTRGGSIHSMLENMCRQRLTVERIGRLERHLNCQADDYTCVR
jgi:uncharacterized protein YecT (DUF1311 family)